MLISFNKRSGEYSYLVPELCRMTGVTDSLKDDFRAMRDIKSVTLSDAPVKVRECLKLFQAILENKACKKKIEDMDF